MVSTLWLKIPHAAVFLLRFVIHSISFIFPLAIIVVYVSELDNEVQAVDRCLPMPSVLATFSGGTMGATTPYTPAKRT